MSSRLSKAVIVVATLVAVYVFLSGQGSGPATEPPLPNGEYLGYIHGVDVSRIQILFDDAMWLTGKAGQDAAIEAGHCTEERRSECLPNDYFIKNDMKKDEIMPLGKNVRVFMQTWKMEETGEVAEREIGLSDFASLINDPSLHWSQLPYNATIQEGRVTHIEEVYIP